jgi:NAD(P)-dependent dehydrogenase (short-subunit alcohol dehydrogenase family)
MMGNLESARPGRVCGKVALVTGAASGIGRATALLLAREGARVVVTDLDGAGAARVAAEVTAARGQAHALALDVKAEQDWQKAVGQVLGMWGKLDVAVNNAGLAAARPLCETSLSEWRRVLAVNLDGVFLGTKYAVLAMRQGQGGSIVNVASASGVRASAGAAAYCASKAGVRMFSRAVALECAQRGDRIRVNTVLPAGVRTALWERMDFWPGLVAEKGGPEGAWQALAQSTPLGRFAEPDEIAQGILYLASDQSSYMTGAELVLDGGYTA